MKCMMAASLLIFAIPTTQVVAQEPAKSTQANSVKPLSVRISTPLITPNGDGFRDSADIHIANNSAPAEATVAIMQGDKRVHEFPAVKSKKETLTWKPSSADGTPLPEGVYECVAEIKTSTGTLAERTSVTIQKTSPLKQSSNLMKKQFPIGVWFDGRVEGINCDAGFHNVPKDMQAAREYYERNFQDVHDHNIDIIVIPNTPPDYRETLLSVADKVGLKVVLEIVELAYVDFGGRHSVRSPDMIQDEAETIKYCQDLVAPLRTHASLMCYQVLDEPSAEQFGNFALISRVLEHVDPDHPSFSCLCNEGELDRTITMGTQMVIFDRYPLHRPSKPGEYDFSLFRGLLNTLDLHRKNLPYWMVIQTFAMDRPTGGCRYPSPEEIRAMTWLSLAHNSKGIFWFLHNSYTQGEKLQGLVDLELKPHPIYAEVSDLSKMLKKLSPILLGLSREKTPAATPQSGFAVESFTDDQGGHYLCVVNTDVLKPATFKGVLKPQTPAAEDTAPKDVLSGEQIPVTSSKDGLSLSIELPAGGGRLFKY